MPVQVLCKARTLGFITAAHLDSWEHIARNEAIVHSQAPFLPSQMYI